MFCGFEVPKELFKNCVRVPVYCVNIYAQIFEGVIFQLFVVNWLSTKFSSSKFHWQDFGLHQLESKIHMNGYACNR